ncbi:Fc.00g021070.m01.CDS01 [Cosmosporella sp. VM-42]
MALLAYPANLIFASPKVGKVHAKIVSQPRLTYSHDNPHQPGEGSFKMATELTVQSERAFQKQPHIFQNSKSRTKTTRPGKGGRRWYKDVGLGFRTPKTAIEGSYIDKKCPFTGLVSIRGRILTGTVVSTKMHRTVVIRREYLHFIPKYSRYEKRHKNLAAHVSPAFRLEEGDQVTVGQCRPLSKTVRFNVLRVLPRTGKQVKKFSKF